MDMSNFQYLLQRKSFNEISNKKIDSKVLFCTGIGVNSKPEIPIRFLSYLLPLLFAVDIFQKSRGQFYIADQAAVRIGYNAEIVCHNADMIQRVIQKFIDMFCPHLISRIDIAYEKKSGDECQSVREQRQKLTDQLITDLLETQHPAILQFARKRSQTTTLQTSLRYMVEHTLFMRDPITTDERLFLIENPDNFQFETLAMIGGPSEKFFYEVRKILLRKYGDNHNDYENMQLFTKIGRIPPYYDRFDEPVISETLSENDVQNFLLHIHPELFTDYKMLIGICSGFPYINLNRTNITLLSENDMEKLQNGFNMLKTFLQQLKK